MSRDDTVLITGAGSGFGRVTSEVLARAGYTVLAGIRDIDGRNAGASGELRRLAADEGLAVHVLELDVADDRSVSAAVAESIERVGRLDVLVNNAGTLLSGPLEAFTIDQVREAFETQVFGALGMNRAVLPHMRSRGRGLLIHLSAIPGRLAIPFFGVFSATKFALEALAETYRYELASFGIDSVLVEPGMYPTPLWAKVQPPVHRERMADYGGLVEKGARLRAAADARFSSPDAPHPREVADTVLSLIEAPAAERPLRTVVGEGPPAQAARAINATQAEGQARVMDALGLGDLMLRAPQEPVGAATQVAR